ncbi:putative toxin-antitoxin system toxin component, PIN family [uncultured Mucilaginibacter sp.]|uniref:putative toxin-antitoxin system toxin component, PIN family n=1 Tax=uncultured Mucilaginibacter sp. TaxID=797541 RepID=UPI0026045E76|nr:putative toxin-antitoxin system toxin component, PIN family [uncultured Mucilaginibacter sp.]
MKIDFFVFDTNTLISSALIKNSTNSKAIDKAIAIGTIAVSQSTFEEFTEVLFRKKFDRYFLGDEERWSILSRLEANSKLFTPDFIITDCRDPKDNKFLELAISANASCIITGDKDLLVLHPFRGISILNAVDFVNSF